MWRFQTIESVFGNDDDEEDSEEEQQQLSRKEQLRQQQLAESKLTSTGGGGLKNGKTQGARVTDAGKLSSQEYPTQATSASSNTKIELNDDEKQELIVCSNISNFNSKNFLKKIIDQNNSHHTISKNSKSHTNKYLYICKKINISFFVS